MLHIKLTHYTFHTFNAMFYITYLQGIGFCPTIYSSKYKCVAYFINLIDALKPINRNEEEYIELYITFLLRLACAKHRYCNNMIIY